MDISYEKVLLSEIEPVLETLSGLKTLFLPIPSNPRGTKSVASIDVPASEAENTNAVPPPTTGKFTEIKFGGVHLRVRTLIII